MFRQRLLPYAIGIILTAICGTANAQSIASIQQVEDSVFIDGRVLDETTEGIIGAVVQLKADSTILSTSYTDEEGFFRLYRPHTALRNPFIRVAYPPYKTQEVLIRNFKKTRVIQMELAPRRAFICIDPIRYRVPLIDPWGPTQRTFLSSDIEQMPH